MTIFNSHINTLVYVSYRESARKTGLRAGGDKTFKTQLPVYGAFLAYRIQLHIDPSGSACIGLPLTVPSAYQLAYGDVPVSRALNIYHFFIHFSNIAKPIRAIQIFMVAAWQIVSSKIDVSNFQYLLVVIRKRSSKCNLFAFLFAYKKYSILITPCTYSEHVLQLVYAE